MDRLAAPDEVVGFWRDAGEERWFEREVNGAKKWAYGDDELDDWDIDARAKAREIIERYGL